MKKGGKARKKTCHFLSKKNKRRNDAYENDNNIGGL
jgi:hypothetical protein